VTEEHPLPPCPACGGVQRWSARKAGGRFVWFHRCTACGHVFVPAEQPKRGLP
jgi:uncharacterized Zn finger protein